MTHRVIIEIGNKTKEIKMILNNVAINVEKSEQFEQTDFRIDGKYKNKVLWMLILLHFESSRPFAKSGWQPLREKMTTGNPVPSGLTVPLKKTGR